MTRSETIHLNIYSATAIDGATWRVHRYGRYIGRTVHGDRFAAYDAMRRLYHNEKV